MNDTYREQISADALEYLESFGDDTYPPELYPFDPEPDPYANEPAYIHNTYSPVIPQHQITKLNTRVDSLESLLLLLFAIVFACIVLWVRWYLKENRK